MPFCRASPLHLPLKFSFALLFSGRFSVFGASDLFLFAQTCQVWYNGQNNSNTERERTAMKASIVIPNLNGKGWLKDSIESVYAQTEQDFELIVVDNGSTDDSLAQARAYCDRPNFVLIENQENTGFSHAANQGIARAQGEYVVMFNNDAFAEPQWLAELIRTADSDKRIFAVQSLMIRHFERTLADDAGDYVNLLAFACKEGDGRRVDRYTRSDKPKRIFSACGGASLYRKSILDKIGGFDENFFAYFEDVDLSWRANNLGYKNVLCPTARCYHICGASTGAVRYNGFKSVQSGRNSLLLPLKNEPLLMLLLNALPLTVGYLLKRYAFHKKGFAAEWDKGMHEAFDILKEHRLNKTPFRLRNLPNYILMEFWMIWNMFPYLWYRLVVVRFDLK
jgi:GT2 family glycosyltransferase